MNALYDMFMRSWAILGFNGTIVCSRHSIGGMGCNYMFSNLFINVWRVIKYKHHSTQQHPNYNQLWGWVIDGFCQPIEFNTMT
jgi:hypothetical protein